MALPYIFSSNFEQGDASEWDSETDPGSLLDFPHYTTLAAIPGMEVPYSGAYCMRINRAGSALDCYLVEGDVNISDGTTAWARFNVYFAVGFAENSTATDGFAIARFRASGGTVLLNAGATYDNTQGETFFSTGAAGFPDVATEPIEEGVWYTIELQLTPDTGGSGSILLYATKEGEPPSTTALVSTTGLTAGFVDVADCLFGAQAVSATTNGVYLLDNFCFDNERMWPEERFTDNRVVYQPGHAFLGPTTIDRAYMSATTAATEMRLYDTDRANLRNENLVAVVRNPSADETVETPNVPLDFARGCYAQITDSADPRAGIVPLDAIGMLKASRCPNGMSSGGIRSLGARR